ncbi:30S ribosomal protein S9 [Hondaea fermentalgiana]|uniref:30S ribosomal protein S9 n=1 Tax=Hondaea fermentalgiana TaxID=2315210 RepID=A0A2R5GV10_9STRA|nr:30S ribosomal protein S9 [Hondaea fermentalgiana]|eukprot:GBG34686.1 30S ribosomal protein S9 [Hondaea fermentalgiana]
MDFSSLFADKLEKSIPSWTEAFGKMSAKDLDEAELIAAGQTPADTKVKIDTSIPLPREPKIDGKGRSYGTGRRKTSTACVWIKPVEAERQEGSGTITVNRRELVKYFHQDPDQRFHAIEPLLVTKTIGNFDVNVVVSGGGYTGQAGAIRHGLARALQNYNPSHRAVLKPLQMLRRDPRMVEPKKGGQPKARKKFQWVKR